MSPQTYSRLEHSLGLLAVVSHLRPDDQVMRAAALVHDVGHLPLSHTLEHSLDVSHHDLGDAQLRAMRPVFGRHGIDVDDVIASVNGEGGSALGSDNGLMKLDHFESYVRSAHVHGATWEPPRDTLGSVELVDGSVSCSVETADYLFTLMAGEAERQTHSHNARVNAATAWLVQRAQSTSASKTLSEISQMSDRDVWTWLESVPETCEATRILLRSPEQWPVRAVDRPTLEPGVLHYEIPRLYLDPPHLDGRPHLWPPSEFAMIQQLSRRFTVGGPPGQATD